MPSPSPSSASSSHRFRRAPMRAFPKSERKAVPDHIPRPPYAVSGQVPLTDMNQVYLHKHPDSVQRMRAAAQLARWALDLACREAKVGVTTDHIDTLIHEALIEKGAYPSPLNYAGFPKSLCSSVNEVICHGIPDGRPLQFGDIVSFDVSCFLNGVHGDNCATIVVGDVEEGFDPSKARSINDAANYNEREQKDWRGIPYRTDLMPGDEQEHFDAMRRLTRATREAVYAAISTCRPGSCLSEIGGAIQTVADRYGYDSVQKYRGHGIAHEFHCAPFVKHFRNQDRLTLEPGMIFTIEPMFVTGKQDCFEWDDQWTVATFDGSMAAQFEHTVHITETSVEILTLPPNDGNTPDR